MKYPQLGPSIEVEEILTEKNIKEDLHCTLAVHTKYRSLLGQIS